MQSYIISAALPFLIICGLFISYRFQSMKVETQTQLERLSSSVAFRVASLIADMDYISSDIIGRPDFLKNARNLSNGEGTNFDLQESYYFLSNDIKAYDRAKSNYQIIWFNDRGNYIDSRAYDVISSFKTTIERQQILDWPEKSIVDERRGSMYVFQSTGNEFFSSGKPELTSVRSVRMPTGIVGYLLIQVPLEHLQYLFSEHDTYQSGMCILTESGDVLYKNKLFPATFDLTGPDMEEDRKSDGERYLYSIFTDRQTGLQVISTKKYGILYREIWSDSWYLLCLALFLLFLMIFCISYYSKKLSIPLVRLKNRMSDTTLNTLSEPEKTKTGSSYDEIETLSHSFDQMRNRLAEMVQKEILITKMQSDERFRALQSQINPHFIFNSLNAISIMGQDGSMERVSTACQELAQLIRYASQQDPNDATVAEEIQHAVSYVDIMQMRYGTRISYDIYSDPETDEISIPRLVLQPFLENIFSHAMDVNHRNIHIEIAATFSNDVLSIVIQDNGKGFPEETILNITKKMENATLGRIQEIREHPVVGGIGIVNTLSRLTLYYGKAFSFEIRNKETEGACISLRIEKRNNYA